MTTGEKKSKISWTLSNKNKKYKYDNYIKCEGIILAWQCSVCVVVLDLVVFLLAVKDNWVIETRRRKLELQMFCAKKDEITKIYFLLDPLSILLILHQY